MSNISRPGGGGSLYFGREGFLYKKKGAIGGRRSTRYIPGGGALTNQKTDLFNKYKPGETGIGAQSTAVRRAKNIRAAVCTPDNKCSPFYNTLGVNQYKKIGSTPQYPAVYYIYPREENPYARRPMAPYVVQPGSESTASGGNGGGSSGGNGGGNSGGGSSGGSSGGSNGGGSSSSGSVMQGNNF